MNLLAVVLAVITHVTVIDPAGGPPLRDVSVVIRDGRIADVGSDIATPPDATVVDGRGKFLIPGLWDMHVHLSGAGESALPHLVENGVTGVRDLGSDLQQIDAWRTKIDAGLIEGPRIIRCGPILNGEKFNAYQLVPGTPEESRGVVRALKQVGVDVIKVHRRLPRDSYFAIIDEAKKLGIAVVGHIPMTVTPEEASDAGQQIEHVTTLFEGTFDKGKDVAASIRAWRESGAADALFARFVKNRTVVDPTLVAGRAAEFQQVVRTMHADGVTLLAGTDMRTPDVLLHDELALLVDSGLTPLEALRAATLTPARVLGLDKELGTIERGKLADLVLLDANPLDDIHNTRRIAAVFAHGRLYRPR